MRHPRVLIGFLIGTLALTGCGQPRDRAPEQAKPAADAAPPPAVDYDRTKAFIALADVPPKIDAPQTPASAPDAARDADRIERVLAEAREQFDQRLYTAAILTLEKGLRRYPTAPEIHRLLGAVCFHQGSTGRAKSHLDRALELDADDAMTHALLGKVSEQAGELDAALVAYRTALLCADNGRPVYRILAELWLAGALEGAGYLTASIEAWTSYEGARKNADGQTRRDLERWSTEAAAPETPFVRVAELHARLGQFDPATESMSRAVLATQDVKRGIELQARYAEFAARAGRADEALTTARKLLEELARRPDANEAATREAFSGIRGIYDAVGRPDRLITDLRSAVAANPRPELLSVLADEQIAAGRTEDADQTLRELLAAHPGDRETYWRLAELQAAAGNRVDALLTLADAVANDPAHASAAGDRAIELIAAEADATAIVNEAGDALTERAADGGLRFLLGRLLEHGGQSEAAAELYRNAIDVAPTFQPAYIALGNRHIDAFEWNAALAVAEQAAAAGLDGAPLHRLLARAHDGLDEIELAEQSYQAAIDANPQDAGPMVDLARMWLRVGGKERMAQRQLESALTVDPALADAYDSLLRQYLGSHEQLGDLDDRIQLGADLLERMRRHVGATPTFERAKALMEYVTARRQNPFAPDLIDRYLASLESIAGSYAADVGALREIGEIHFTRGDFPAAGMAIERALQRSPEDVDAREMLFRVRHRMLRQDDAIEILNGLIEDFPRRAGYWERLVAMHLIDQDWETAIELLQRLIDEPYMADMRQRMQAELVNTLDLAGRTDEAIAVARGGFDAARDDAAARALYATILQATDRSDELLRVAEAEYGRNPTDGLARALLIDACMEADQPELAMARFMKWLEEDPENPALNGVLFNSLLRADAHASAIELAESFRVGVEDDDGFSLMRALVIANRDNEAVEVGREWSRTQTSAFAQDWYARLLIEAGRHGEAETFLRQLADSQRSYDLRKAFLLRLSYCYQQMGENQAAENALKEIYDMNPVDVEICNDLGYTWTDAGKNLEQSEDMIRRALASRPRSAAYLDSLGWVRYKRGDFAEARKWLERATRARPIVQLDNVDAWVIDAADRSPGEDPVIYDHLGDASYRLGDRDAALAAWRTAVKIHEDNTDQESGRDDTRLVAAVREKIAALEAGSTADVAAVVGDAEAEDDAK